MALKMALKSVKAVICAPLAATRPKAATGFRRAGHARANAALPQGQLPIARAMNIPLFPLMTRSLMLGAASVAAEPLSPEFEAYVQGDEDLAQLSPCARHSRARL